MKKFIKHKGAVLGSLTILLFILLAIFAPLLSDATPSKVFPGALVLSPGDYSNGRLFFLGSDDIGRDLFTRLVYGARISLMVGAFVVLISGIFGTLLGLIGGFFGGLTDRLIMRIMDIIMAFPSILLAICVVSILGPGLLNAVVAVAIVSIPGFTRLIRSRVLEERSKCYVDASRSFGASPWRILFKEIFPNCIPALIVQATLGFSDGILNAAALGFLGLGAQPPTPEWGIMLADARPYIERAPWLVTLPGLCILINVLGLNIFGDGLRDILDPRLKGKG